MTMCERVGTKGEHVPVDNHHIDLTILSERKKDVVHFCFRKKHAQRSQSGNVWVIGVQVSNWPHLCLASQIWRARTREGSIPRCPAATFDRLGD